MCKGNDRTTQPDRHGWRNTLRIVALSRRWGAWTPRLTRSGDSRGDRQRDNDTTAAGADRRSRSSGKAVHDSEGA